MPPSDGNSFAADNINFGAADWNFANLTPLPSSAFLRAAAEASREPVLLMAVESPDAIKEAITTQADWEAAQDLPITLNISEFPGSVTLDRTLLVTSDLVANRNAIYTVAALPCNGYLVLGQNLVVQWGNLAETNPATIAGRIVARLNSRTGSIIGQTDELTITADGTSTFDKTRYAFFPELVMPNIPFNAGDVIYLRFEATDVFDVESIGGGPLQFIGTNSAIRTEIIDLGVTPAVTSVLSIDDVKPAGTAIAYTARGRNNSDDAWVDLGSVDDGSILAAYRYYDFTAAFSSDGRLGVRLHEIAIAGGDSQFRYYSTHRGEPVPGAFPYLKSVSSLTSKIELQKAPTTGEITAVLHWTQETSDLLATGYLKNKAVSIKMGFAGLAEVDYQPIFTGFWYDYSVSPSKREIKVKLRDVLKRFAKRKVPQESFNKTTGQKMTTAVEWDNVNVFQVFLDIFDQLGIPDRYIFRSEFENLRDYIRSGPEWNVTRRLGGLKPNSDEYRAPIAADKLLEELMAIAGVFLVPLPDGRLKPVLYDESAEAVATFDAIACDFGDIEGGQKELFTRAYVYYEPLTEDAGDSPEDYAKGYLRVDTPAEIAWGEEDNGQEKFFYDRWGTSETAIEALADRLIGWFANPHATVSCVAPPRLAGVLPGQVVAVDNLRLPAAAADWPGLTSGRKMLVMSRKLDPKDGRLSFDLMDLTGGSQGVGTWANPLAISGPATPYDAGNLYTVTGGAPPYTWRSSKGTLTDNADGTANLDLSGASGAGTLSVSDASGTALLRFTVLPRAVSGFLVGQQPDGTRQFTWNAIAEAAGYRLRYKAGSGHAWEDMDPLHAGLLTASPWETNLLAAGTFTFAIRAVDSLGNESGAPTYIEATLADARSAYYAAAESAASLGWPGILTDCHIDENNVLVANDATTWADLTTWEATIAWAPAPLSPIVYEHSIDLGLTTSFTPVITAIGDGTVTVEMNHSTDGVTWSGWLPLGFVSAARYFKARATVAGAYPTLSAFDVLLAARPVEEFINDLDTATLAGSYDLGTGNVRIPLTRTYQRITGVFVTLQNVGAGWTWELIDKDVAPGPQIKIYDGSQTPADAVIDVIIRGL